MVKTCSKYGETKPYSEFYASAGTRDGQRNPCKSCCLRRQANYDARADVQAARREYRQANAVAIAEARRRWRLANPELHAARSAEWKRANPDAHARHKSKDRARRYGAEHEPYSRAEVFARWGSRCCYCNEPATSIDHVVPLSRGGHDVEANAVPCCKSCNSSKGRKTLAEWAAS
ncbi:HNH endonuclease [Streptomyces sp. NPDC097617]|uniref:HNH endonuclease n=1 Tax=Streptomyces sp. NPDC097617 TaxID=3366091 RepID=UPI0038108706